MKVLPKLGQQVCVQYLDIYLVPVTFVGWCIDVSSQSFTLTDGYSRRQFLIISPMVLLVAQFSTADYQYSSKPFDRKRFYEHRERAVQLHRDLTLFSKFKI